MSEITKPAVMAEYPGHRVLVYATEDLTAKQVVKLAGTETVTGVPDVAVAGVPTDECFGVMEEDVEATKQGICIIGVNCIVWVVAGAAVTIGNRLMADAAGTVEPYVKAAETRGILGIAKSSQATIGEDVKCILKQQVDSGSA